MMRVGPMRLWLVWGLLLGLFACLPQPVQAQGAVQQLGPVTPLHLPMWAARGLLMDAGGSPGAGLQPLNNTNTGTLPTGLGIVNSGLGNCQWSGYANAGYSELCTGFDGNGNVVFVVGREGGGPLPECHFLINGVLTPCAGGGSGGPFMLPDGSNATAGVLRNIGAAAQITTAGLISTRPSPLGNWDSYSTACTGDLSGTVLASCFKITGAATLGQPTTGYQYTFETAPFPNYLLNQSGWNQSLTGNDGRTAAVLHHGHVFQAGQGDLAAYNCAGFVLGTRAGSTNFLANPAVSCFNGHMSVGTAGAYLNWGEALLSDAGFDAAGIGWVVRLARTVTTGAKNVNWGGYIVQSTGGKPVDWAYKVSGPVRMALDLSGATYPSLTLLRADLTNGGTGYTAGDILVPSDGTGDQITTLKVLTVNGSGVILTLAVDRGGLYTAVPTVANSVTGGSGSGAVVALQYSTTGSAPALVTKADSCWYGNATAGSDAFGTAFSSTVRLGNAHLCYFTSLPGWNVSVNNDAILSVYGDKIIAIKDLQLARHFRAGGTAPALTSCGTSPSILGGDAAGHVVMGTGSPASCVINFIIAYAVAPSCVVTWRSNLAAMAYAISTTALTLTQTPTSGNAVDYVCVAQNTG